MAYDLWVELTGLVDGLTMERERRREIEDDFYVLGLRCWMDNGATY